MTEHFVRFDDALIDRLFQPLADRLDRHWALGPHRAARGFLDLASLAWIFAEASALAAAMVNHDMQAAILRSLLVVLGLGALTILRGVFGKTDGGPRSTAEANPLRPGMQTHRVLCLAWMVALAVKAFAAPGGFGSLALLAVGVFATAAVYFGACTHSPPPWRRPRARKRGWTLAAGGL